MNDFRKSLKKYKLFHWVYNLVHFRELQHNKKAYKQYGIHKGLYESISSRDFPDRESKAWLDIQNSHQAAPVTKGFSEFPQFIQQQLLSWSDNGYLILNKFFNDEIIDSINKDIERLVAEHAIAFTHDHKLPFANKKSKIIKGVTRNPELVSILEFILGKEVVPFQTLNFIKGSSQRAHSDSIHMTTYPLGYLIAVWIALEDIHPDSGPLFYYPGTHRFPYLLNNDFNNAGTPFQLGDHDYPEYEDMIEKTIREKNLKPEAFLARKGDVFVWHANLIHGGSPIIDQNRTRKSMVIHYYAKDVIKYHEISERPSLMKNE